MQNFKDICDKIRIDLDQKNTAREEILRLSREIIRASANSIRAAHREEYDESYLILLSAKESVNRLREILANNPEVYYAGYVHDCQKEYAEASVTLSIFREEANLPSPDDLNIENPAFLNGLGEVIGEIRRRILDLIRLGEAEKGTAQLKVMDEFYYALITFDYPDAITNGLRRTTDVARGILEKTRGDLVNAIRQNELEAVLRETSENLGKFSS